jgi:4-hydroxy-2-oxoheptanedioate aldolase
MRPNPLREAIKSGDVALGGWLSLASTPSAEVMGSAGFAYVNIDMQHGLIDYPAVVGMIQAIAIGSSTPLVRVPANDAGTIGKALDAGAMGVIVPMVNSRAQCQAAIQAGKYAPAGNRSFGPAGALLREGADYYDHANDTTLVIPMIETAEAIANLDDILSVEGVEVIYVGPADLAISLGYRPGSTDDGFHDALAAIVAACERHGVVPGIHASAALRVDRQSRGFGMITVSADLVGLKRAVSEDFDHATKIASEAKGDQETLY